MPEEVFEVLPLGVERELLGKRRGKKWSVHELEQAQEQERAKKKVGQNTHANICTDIR